jgi:hypothetical protein
MSTEIRGKIGIEGYGVEGSYKKEYGVPLVIEPCQHHVQIEKKEVGWIRKKVIEEWIRTIHGRPDGSTSVTWNCRNEDGVKRIESNNDT